MASDSQIRTTNPVLAFLGIATAFIVVPAVFIGTLALKRPFNEVEQRRSAQRLETRTKLEIAAIGQLNSLGWVDKEKGIAHVPIVEAMTMVVADLAAKKPVPTAVKVEPPLPMPVIDPASSEPPPSALPSAPQGADTVRFPIPVAPETAPAPAQIDPAPPTDGKAPIPASEQNPAPVAPQVTPTSGLGKPSAPVNPTENTVLTK